jgi:hypothetical protein
MNPSDRDDATIDIDLTPAPALPGQVFGNPEAIWANVVLDVILYISKASATRSKM